MMCDINIAYYIPTLALEQTCLFSSYQKIQLQLDSMFLQFK